MSPLRRLRRAALVVACVVAAVVASGCCCPCSYVGGVPDVAVEVRREIAPPRAPVAAVRP